MVNLLNSKKVVSDKEISDVTTSLIKVERRDAEVQVNIPKMFMLSDLITTDCLRSFTGINNFKILECVVEITKRILPKDTRSHRLNVNDRIILTMTKLKLDLSYVTLGALFSISRQLCKTYFYNMLTILSKVLKTCIYFSSVDKKGKNLPKCFENLNNCRVVLDCIEIF